MCNELLNYILNYRLVLVYGSFMFLFFLTWFKIGDATTILFFGDNYSKAFLNLLIFRLIPILPPIRNAFIYFLKYFLNTRFKHLKMIFRFTEINLVTIHKHGH